MILAWSDVVHHFYGHTQDLTITNNRTISTISNILPFETTIIFLHPSLCNYTPTIFKPFKDVYPIDNSMILVLHSHNTLILSLHMVKYYRRIP